AQISSLALSCRASPYSVASSLSSFHHTAPPDIYTLSLHDALPISAGGAAGQAGAVGTDPPHGGGLRPGRDDLYRIGTGIGGHCVGPVEGVLGAVATDLDQQPAGTLGQVWDGVVALVLAHHVHQLGIQSFHGEHVVAEHRRDRIGG